MKMWRLATLFTTLALFLSGCGKENTSTLIPKGEVAKMQYDLIMLSLAIMVLVCVVVTVIFLFVIIKFRQRKGKEDVIPKQVEGSHTLEIIWTVIPIILLIVLAIPTVTMTFDLADTKEINKKNSDAVVVDVTAKAFWWEFKYKKDEVVTSQELVIPVGERVYFKLKGGDIKHSFWVPALGGKMDTNTDNVNEMYLVADEAGTYQGYCAEFCGPSHGLMQFEVIALPKDEYDQWVQDMKTTKHVAVTAEAQAGEELFAKNCLSCHAIEGTDKNPDVAAVAPNLANFGDRNLVGGINKQNEKNIKEWIANSAKVKPGSKMPSFENLTEEELNELTAYLMGLKVAK